MRNYVTKLDNTAPGPSGILGADEDNVRFAELLAAVVTAGMVADPIDGPSTDNSMLSQAMARYASGGIGCTNSGGANAYVLSATGSFVLPKAHFKPLRPSPRGIPFIDLSRDG